MCKIGIITLSASDNCGSLLQTYALQQVIKNRFNCDVEIINFISTQSEKVYSLFPNHFYKHPKKTLFTVRNLKSIRKQKEGYQNFRNKFLNMSFKTYKNIESLKTLEKDYDIIITGSDQVWNVNMADYSDAFFIPGNNNVKKIAYATSLGSAQVIEHKKAEQIKIMLADFSAISVREETGKVTIEQLTNKNVYLTADPTLLISKSEWFQLAGKQQITSKYIFYYSWAYSDDEMNLLVQKFAKEKKLQVYVINSSKWYKYRPDKFEFKLYRESGPIAFLNLMKYAEYVFVQSFHGAVFANVFNKRFFFLNEMENDQVDFRTKNIIGIFHEEKQIVHEYKDLDIAMNTELAYKSDEYNELVQNSFDFLDQSLADTDIKKFKSKHAYMIMAHHRPDLLQYLINALDDERNDIVIHIDQKSPMKQKFHAKYAKLYFIDRISVNWGGYSQVECEYKLLKKAVAIGHHTYYHFLTGANYPLWNQDVLHQYFEKNSGTEYIGFDEAIDFSFRARYYTPFSEHGKLSGLSGKAIKVIRKNHIMFQKVLGMDRLKNSNLTIKKGCAYYSVTEDFVKELIKNEARVKRLFKHTLCCDEVFVQTIAYNSKYKNKINILNNEWDGAMRELAWPSNVPGEHPGLNFSMKDLNYLLNSKRFFAMKFESPDGVKVIEKIKEKRNIS